MTEPPTPDPGPAHEPAPAPGENGPAAEPGLPAAVPPRQTYLQRRRDRFVAEIERNREGGHRVPTWVLAAALFAFVALWAAVIIFS